MKIKTRVKSIIRHGENAATILFDSLPEFKYLPGQFINLTVDINGELFSRSYSLSSVDDEDDSPAITVKRVQNGIVSNYLVDSAEELNEIYIEGPFGTF